jgi:hypothetical protein
MRHSFQSVIFTATIALALVGLASAPAAAQERKTIWSGTFSDAQAARGETAFMANCARCHLEDLSGKNGPPLRGPRFLEDWREASLDILFSTVKSMPPNTQRNPVPRLPESTSLDILTHILKVNGAPTGPQELKVEALPSIQFEKQTGPEAVPNLTLVRVVGCLSLASPTTWAVTAASDPTRAMDPEVLSPAELNAAKLAGTGQNSYRLSQIDYIDKPIADYRDHMVAIKGTLVRADTGVRVNLTAMESIAATCSR